MVGGLYGVVLASFALQPQYLLPALASLVCVVGAASDRLSLTWGRTLVVAITFLIVVTTWPGGLAGASDRGLREDLRWLGDVLRAREALVDGGHVYRYYLGENYMIRRITASYQGNSLSLRKGGRYRALGLEDMARKVVVIQKGRQGFFGSSAEEALLGSCSRIGRLTITIIYDCAVGRAKPERASPGSALCDVGDVGA